MLRYIYIEIRENIRHCASRKIKKRAKFCGDEISNVNLARVFSVRRADGRNKTGGIAVRATTAAQSKKREGAIGREV